MKAVVKAFDEVAARGFRGRDHLRGILRIVREGLFDQHVFAVRQRRRAPLQVRGGRQGDVNQVDVVAREQLCITTERERQGVLRGEVLRALQGARRDCDGLGSEQVVGRGHDAARRDPCRAQDSDAYHGAAVSHDCRRCGTLSPRELRTGANVTRAVLIGATGRMGAAIVRASAAGGVEIVAAVASPGASRRASTSAKSRAARRSAFACSPNYPQTWARPPSQSTSRGPS